MCTFGRRFMEVLSHSWSCLVRRMACSLALSGGVGHIAFFSGKKSWNERNV